MQQPALDSDESSEKQARRNNIFARQNEFEAQNKQYMSPKNLAKHHDDDDYEEDEKMDADEAN